MADTADGKHVTRGGDRVADVEEFRARRSRVIYEGVLGAGQGGELRVHLGQCRERCRAGSGVTRRFSAARAQQHEGECNRGPDMRLHAPSVAGIGAV